MEHLVQLLSCGHVLPVVDYVAHCMEMESLDQSHIRHFVAEVGCDTVCFIDTSEYSLLSLLFGWCCTKLGWSIFIVLIAMGGVVGRDCWCHNRNFGQSAMASFMTTEAHYLIIQ